MKVIVELLDAEALWTLVWHGCVPTGRIRTPCALINGFTAIRRLFVLSWLRLPADHDLI